MQPETNGYWDSYNEVKFYLKNMVSPAFIINSNFII